MIGTSDQSCWLAEACKILLLLLLLDATLPAHQNSVSLFSLCVSVLPVLLYRRVNSMFP